MMPEGEELMIPVGGLSFREVGYRLFLQNLQVGIPHLTHHRMQTATFFIAVLASLVEVQADAGQQGNGAIQ
jgi:hypothetical protein